MSSSLLIILLFVDIILLGVIFYLGKKRINPLDIVREISEERRLLLEMNKNFKEEMTAERLRNKEMADKVAAMATDVELEVKNSSQTLRSELDSVMPLFDQQVKEPLDELNKRITVLDGLYRKIQRERKVLNRGLERAEQFVRVFSGKAPYEKVLSEIEDKKFGDAREMLAQGMHPRQVASELGMAESEVVLLASMA